MSHGNIIKIFYHGLNEITQEVLNAVSGGIFLYKTSNQAYQLLEDKVLLKLNWSRYQKTKSFLKKIVAFAAEGSSNSDTDKIMAQIDAMTMKIDAQYKEFQSRSKPNPDHNDDDIPMSREEEAKFMQTFRHEGSEILHSIEVTILEEKLFVEFDEFMAMTADENSESEADTEEPPFEKISFNTDYKIKTSLEEPPMDLKHKPLPVNLEYVFMEEPSFLYVIISSQLSEENKNKLVPVFKRHKQAFSWKTTNIPRICPSFCKRKFQLLEDNKPVVKKKRLNPNMCMLAVFHDMIEEFVEVFMDDFSVFGSYFDHCLNNLDKMLQRYKDAHLVLNWEKCHFIFKEGIVHGHKVSEAGLKVDKAKIKVISKLPPPTNIKDRTGIENVAVDHLSRIENEETRDDSEGDDNFPRETLMEINIKDEP
nr:retrovirus-related Pol polyprotein [Tanacetum cinerariifolium]